MMPRNPRRGTFKVVIPARYASARLPAKPLLDIGGRPMIQWVIAAAVQSGADEVLVATDDERIAAAAIDPRSRQSIAVMTSTEHLPALIASPRSRAKRGWSERTIVVNVQGDEPHVAAGVGRAGRRAAGAACGCRHRDAVDAGHQLARISRSECGEGRDRHAMGPALYFSRAPIPWTRDGAPQGLSEPGEFAGAQRHLGIYAYRVDALQARDGFAAGASWSSRKN